MTLREALVLAGTPAGAGSAPWSLSVVCGFELLHLGTFLKAHLHQTLRRPVALAAGLYGDWEGNLARALAAGPAPLALLLEWADLDPRLGLREGFRPNERDEEAILADAGARLDRIAATLAHAAPSRRCVLSLPATPLPPWRLGLPGQSAVFELDLRARLSRFACQCAQAGVRVLGPIQEEAYDYRAHLASGFPYRNVYADRLAAGLAGLLVPPQPKKALVTDLDQTLWRGVVGDDGPERMQWALEGNARLHGLYQQFLAGLAASGVFVGVASKNDPGPVTEALRRPDLLLPASALFPIEANWGEKAASLRRLAAAWNIGLDAIVFVDDNPLEIATMQATLPEVECHQFPAGDPVAVLALLEQLRLRFAKEKVTAEDRLRGESVRLAPPPVPAGANPEELLAGLEARLTVDFRLAPVDPRALELINKTNQFNLNGRRWEESEFLAFLTRPGAVLAVASYQDRFGLLGKIAVLAGRLDGATLHIDSWVISCRAFSRRIEYSLLQAVVQQYAVDTLVFDWCPTPRNGPSRDALSPFWENGMPAEPATLTLSREAFESRCPVLYAAIDAVR